ncbi:MAG: GtrA family protein [Marinibacterium sp.]|nr:GtrA family protein [Marinibacterium sp.]
MTRAEVGQILRFGVVGVTVAALYVLLYAGLKTVMVQPVANAVAFLIAVAVQYVGQTVLTFRRPLGVPAQIGRFIAMISAGLVMSAILTGAVGPVLGLADWVAAAAVTVILPVQNYLFMKLWVYSAKEATA